MRARTSQTACARGVPAAACTPVPAVTTGAPPRAPWRSSHRPRAIVCPARPPPLTAAAAAAALRARACASRQAPPVRAPHELYSGGAPVKGKSLANPVAADDNLRILAAGRSPSSTIAMLS